MLAREGVNAVITGEAGPKAMQALKTAGIDVLYMSSGTVEQAIQRYKSGTLEKQPSLTAPSSKQSPAQANNKTTRLAVATDGDEVSQHFGHCSQYTLVDIVNGHIENKSVIANPGHQPGFLPRYLADKGVNYIIAGGMGTQAQSLFKEMGVEPILGVSGNIDEVIDAFINGTLQSGESLCEH
jgi:Dinitrogenase iron-molybdenum cofactor.